MSGKKDRNMDKRIKKQMRKEAVARNKNMMPWIFGGVLLVIALIVGGSLLSGSYDKSQETAANVESLYVNKITPAVLKDKIEAKEDFFAYFYQTSCIHCKAVSPILIPMAEEMGKPLFPINIEYDNKTWDEYQIPGTPTLIHFKDGKEVGKIVGEQPQDKFREFLNQ